MSEIKFRTNRQRKDHAVACGEMLTDFVSAEAPEKGCKKFVKEFRSKFGCKVSGHYQGEFSEERNEGVKSEQDKISIIFNDFLNGKDLGKNTLWDDYFGLYCLVIQNFSHVEIPEELPSLDKKSIKQHGEYRVTGYGEALAYCIITFLYSEVSPRLYKCELCKKLGLGASTRKQFCDKICANKHTASKTDPKARREYREKRRSNGLE